MAVFRRRWPGVSYGRGEDWHYVGEAGEPAFENGWENVPGDINMAFRIREAGVVDIHGSVQSGTPGAAVFTLPEGYRPSSVTGTPLAVGLSDLSPLTASLFQFLAVEADGTVSNADCVSMSVFGQYFLVPASAP